MVTVNNPVEASYSIALGNHGTQRAKLMEAATTGEKQDITVVDAILGSKARSAANLGGKVITGMGTGFSIISTATSALKNIRDQLESIKQELATLNNADAQTLEIAQINYQNQMDRINGILINTNFAGKRLFDGTLASPTAAAAVAEEALPTPFGPLQVQAGINTGDVINISIPKLLAGDGTAVDAAVTGRFQPLFRNLNNFFGLQNAAANAIKTAINAGGVNTIADVIAATPGAASNIRTFVVVINTAIDTEKGNNNGSATANNSRDSINGVADAAAVFLNAALTANGNPTAITATQINAARDAIKAVITTSAVGAGSADPVRKAARDLNVAPLYPANANSQLKSVYDAIAAAVKQTGNAMEKGNGVNNANAGTELKAADNAAIDAIMPVARAITSPTGNVETPAGRAQATTLIDNAITTLDGVISGLTGQQNALTAAKANLEDLVKELHTAADNYLSTDYEKVIPELTKLLREDRVASLAFGLSERAINAIISQMESVAAAAT